MHYEDARPLIQTGDLIAVRRRSGPLAVATRAITDSPYTHTGTALWAGERLLLAHINGGGCSFVPLSQEAEYGFDAYECPVDRSMAEQLIWQMFGVHIAYGFAHLVRIALFLWFGVPLPKQGDDYICSALSARIYLMAGWKPQCLPSIPWPGAIAAELGAPIAEVDPSRPSIQPKLKDF
jgi:hypothetical protein